MIETTLPLVPDPAAAMPAAAPAPLLEQLETLRLENAALRPQNAAFKSKSVNWKPHSG